MKLFLKIFSIFIITTSLVNCGGGGGGGQKNPFDPDLALDPLPGLFGVWECTSTITSVSCNDELSEDQVGLITTEEYRIFENEDDCALDDQTETGEALDSDWTIFPKETTCRSGSDLVLLEFSETVSEGDCSATTKMTVPLRLADDQLSGDGVVTVNISDACFEGPDGDFDCVITASLVCEPITE